jgi:hypothetical protein
VKWKALWALINIAVGNGQQIDKSKACVFDHIVNTLRARTQAFEKSATGFLTTPRG